MKKLKVSKSDVKGNYYILGIGYCNAQHLLDGIDPFGYSAGVYGWACDYYEIKEENIVISTGYSYLEQNIKNNYDITRKYDEKALKIWNDYKKYDSYDKRKKAVYKLLIKYIKEIKKMNGLL